MHISDLTSAERKAVVNLVVEDECTADSCSDRETETAGGSFGGTGVVLRQSSAVYIIFHFAGEMEGIFDGCLEASPFEIGDGVASMDDFAFLAVYNPCGGDAYSGIRCVVQIGRNDGSYFM